MILFFDLDGPLLDVSRRYVTLHRDLLRELGVAAMDADRYWECKRALISEEAILAELGIERHAVQYAPRRLDLIESATYLRHDRCWPWTLGCLTRLSQHATLVMVTARGKRVALLRQLDDLGLTTFFDEILSERGVNRVDLQKAALIGDYLRRHERVGAGSWMVGDTEADVRAGKLAGLKTVAVLSGIRDEAHLRLAEPHHLLNSIEELADLLDLPPLTMTKAKRALSVS
jgi:phosphoglycolate phosphatase-like HAD superfamily hydrolase